MTWSPEKIPAAPFLRREEICAQVLTSAAPVFVIEAPAGMGKSVLLTLLAEAAGAARIETGPQPLDLVEDSLLLWDVPTAGGVLPEHLGRIILARRPGAPIEGLARASAYGRVATLRSASLTMTAEELVREGFPPARARALIAASGGWPVLFGLAARGEGTDLEAYFREELTPDLTPGSLVALQTSLAGRPVAEPLAADLPPLPKQAAMRQALASAVQAEICARVQRPVEATLLSRLLLDGGQAADAIGLLQEGGDMDAALAMFEREGGPYFVHRHGPEAFDRVLAGFAKAKVEDHQALQAARVMQAAKSGELPLALRLLGDYFGPGINQPDLVYARQSPFSVLVRLIRLVIFIYEDVRFSEAMMDSVARLLDALPIDAHILRGSYHNAILEFRLRSRRPALARDAAFAAMTHYRKAEVPILEFYVSLHLAFIELMSGALAAARKAEADAAAALARCRFDSPGDHRILALVRAATEFEAGRPEPLAAFVDSDFEAFARGEIWPSLTEIALQYGSTLIAARDGVNAARGFLDRLRLHHARTAQLHGLIDIREAVILQDAGRWQEAAEMLGAMGDRTPRFSLPDEGLAVTEDRDVIAYALARLRQAAYHARTGDPSGAALQALGRNPRLTQQQRVSIAVLLAWLQRRERDVSGVRRSLRALFEAAARDGTVAALAAEAVFLEELLANRRIRSFLDASEACRTLMRRLRDSAATRPHDGLDAGLTRREARLLDALCEGASNKLMAKTLGLSESTVKFHLANLYRKLGVDNRRDAVARAHLAEG